MDGRNTGEKKPNANYTISYLIALNKQPNEIKDKYL